MGISYCHPEHFWTVFNLNENNNVRPTKLNLVDTMGVMVEAI